MNPSISGHAKSTFKFNEVTSMTGVKPYVLRFWESEFDQIDPKLNEIGQKIYDSSDIAAVERVKKLLFEDKLSIPQAKGYLDRQNLESVDENDFYFEDEQFEDEQLKEQFIEEGCIEEQNEVEVPTDFDQISLKSRSLDLKKALELIIEKNSTRSIEPALASPSSSADPYMEDLLLVESNDDKVYSETSCGAAENVIESVREAIEKQRHLLDRDVVNLVSAKKKLSVLTARIDEICWRNNWH